MPVVACTKCGRRFRADPALQGKRVACPRCDALMEVPEEDLDATIAGGVNEPLDEPEMRLPSSGRWVDRAIDTLTHTVPEAPCGKCGKMIPGDSDACPHCGHVVSLAAISAGLEATHKVKIKRPNKQLGTAKVIMGLLGRPFVKLGSGVASLFRNSAATIIVFLLLVGAAVGGYFIWQEYGAKRTVGRAFSHATDDLSRPMRNVVGQVLAQVVRGWRRVGVEPMFNPNIDEVTFPPPSVDSGMLEHELACKLKIRGGFVLDGVYNRDTGELTFNAFIQQATDVIEIQGNAHLEAESASVTISMDGDVYQATIGKGSKARTFLVNGKPPGSGKAKSPKKGTDVDPDVPIVPIVPGR